MKIPSRLPRPVRAALQLLDPPEHRSFLQFCEDEIVHSDGPRKGNFFSADYMPFTKILLQEADNPRWKRQFWAGPSQGAKTFLGTVCRIIYRLHECSRDVAVGAPTTDMFLANIWTPKIKPVIRACNRRGKLLDFLPQSGQGSRGGKFTAMEMGNGSMLHVMGAGGGDAQRISLTVEDLITTELDQLGDVKAGSKEGTPIEQMEARLGAYEGSGHARTYGECVVHSSNDLIWHEVTKVGTGGRIFIRCPHCGDWIWPERKHFIGWQNAESEWEAEDKAAFICPECGCNWTENDRTAANQEPRLVRRGQSVDQHGHVVGDLPKGKTDGIRWDFMHLNAEMRSMANVAAHEWRAERSEDEGKRKAVFWKNWSEPYEPEGGIITEITSEYVRSRSGDYVRGEVPAVGGHITVQIDLGEQWCHWMAKHWSKGADDLLEEVAVFDFGVIEVPRVEMTIEDALLAALRDFRDTTLAHGWADPDGNTRVFDRCAIDSGHLPAVVYQLVMESNPSEGAKKYFATKGHGMSARSPFRKPKKSVKGKVMVGNEWFLQKQEKTPIWLLHINADHWKQFDHHRWLTPASSTGRQTVFTPQDHQDRKDLLTFSRHIIAERTVPTEITIRGEKIHSFEFRQKSNNNHYLDASAMGNVLGDLLGYRLVPSLTKKNRATKPQRPADRVAPQKRRPMRRRY